MREQPSGSPTDLAPATDGLLSTTDGGDASDLASFADGATQCVALGQSCALRPCCDGQCDPFGGRCTHGAGGTCDVTVENPNAYCTLGTTCDLAAGKCVALTCIPPGFEAVCSSLPGIPCCSASAVCTGVPLQLPGGGVLYRCCAPLGTLLPNAQGTLCCSNATLHVDESTVKCIENPQMD